MSNTNFSFEGVKEITGKRLYQVGINTESNYISKAEYNEQYDSLDITFENDSNSYRERIFNPTKNVPEWTTADKELKKTQRRIMHILLRFMPLDDAQNIKGTNWKEMCENVSSILLEKSHGKHFELKFIFDKKFEYPELGAIPFIRIEGDKPLNYTDWENKNRMLVESNTKPETTEEDDIF